ncbi:hypothetical protein ACOMHN_028227 [Nucella lapillus]
MKAHDGVRDRSSESNAAQRWASEGQKYGRNAAGYDDAAAKDAAKAQQTGSDYGSRASNWDQNAASQSRAADGASQSAYGRNRWADAADANKASRDQESTQGNQWYQGRRNNDGIDYAYDKSFDLKDTENGGFELAESSDSHALDDFKDRAASYDRNVDKDAAWASAADAAAANRKSAWGQNAASGASSWDKFSKDAASTNSANGRDKDWANKVDHSQGGHRLWSDARKAASDVYKGLTTADGSYKRNNDLGNNYGQGHGTPYGQGHGTPYGQGHGTPYGQGHGTPYGQGHGTPYGYGVAGVGGYAAKPGYYAPRAGYGKGADAAHAWDQAAKTGLRQSDSAASSDQTKAAFNRDQWLNDRNRGYDRNAKKAASDKGASDWARQAAQSANKADTAHDDSANAWNKDQAKSSLDENLWKKEAEKKRLSDRNNKRKVYKKWFNNKHRGGDNWERLNFDKKKSDDAFGYDTAAKKDWARASNANQWRSAADQNGKNAWASRQAAAAKNAQKADWKKDAAGWQNANAATRASDAAQRKGWNNEQWKDNQARNAHDARAQNAQVWDKDADRANAAASYSGNGGVGYGAYGGNGGVSYGAYGGNGGVGYGAYGGKGGVGYGAYGGKGGVGYGAYDAYPNNGYNGGYGAPSKGYGYNNHL